MPMIPTTSDPLTMLVLFALKAAAVGGVGTGSLHLIYRQHKRQQKFPKLHKTPDAALKAEYEQALAADRETSVAAFALGSAFGTMGAIPMLAHFGGAPFLRALQAAALASATMSPLYGLVATGNSKLVAKNPVRSALAATALAGGAVVGTQVLAHTAPEAAAALLREAGMTALVGGMAFDTYALMVHASNPVINPKVMLAEFIGTGALIFIGAGTGALGKAGLVGVAFAHGLVLSCFAYAYGHLSGVHINPAVTAGFLLAGRYDALQLTDDDANFAKGAISGVVNYWIPQCLGSIAAAGGLALCLSGQHTGLGATLLGADVSWLQGFTLETTMTFLLMNTILHTTDQYGSAGGMAPWAIGSTLTFCILMDGPLTGASLNPARTLGPNLFANVFWSTPNTIIYFTAPFLGAAIASMVWGGMATLQAPTKEE